MILRPHVKQGESFDEEKFLCALEMEKGEKVDHEWTLREVHDFILRIMNEDWALETKTGTIYGGLCVLLGCDDAEDNEEDVSKYSFDKFLEYKQYCSLEEEKALKIDELLPSRAKCEICGTVFLVEEGYYEPDEYAYCSDCCHW